MTGGVAGFVGTYLIGPRTGVFKREMTLDYILDEENFDDHNDLLAERLKDSRSKEGRKNRFTAENHLVKKFSEKLRDKSSSHSGERYRTNKNDSL